jgi:cellulose synthase/poly-beta-1,6-N-acetylglucosamine synthase-like glycosyltransferase
MPTWFSIIAYSVLAVLAVKVAATCLLARRYHRERAWEAPRHLQPTSASVIVPAYNEELTLANCLASLDRQTFDGLEIIVVDDGSTDGTEELARQLAGTMRTPTRVLSKPNGGKASALNFGLAHAAGDVVICVDADSILAPDAVAHIVEPFGNPAIGAVGGIVKVANDTTLLGRQQALEYISGLSIQRAAFAQVDSIQVLSGAISAFRATDLRGIGGYSPDTIVEDFDVTLAIQRAGHRAVLHPKAVAYTEGPLTIRDLLRQRHRWTYGGFQVLGKYRSTLFTDRMGLLSRVGLPYFLLFPWVDVLVSALFIVTAGYAVLSGSISEYLVVFGVLSLVALGLNTYALHLAGEPRRLAFWGLVQPLGYAHLLTFATARAGVHYVLRREARWHKLQRAGANVVMVEPAAVATARVRELQPA